ncbi:P-loop containing nucleoside triphosphate hydrolase protein [Morchella snyderi]|nr:P-loop containing nucleoside triphosphate hydrolase protein [Morchella snyderi]
MGRAFCGDPEGWGPLSPAGRSDFTPCFLDATIDFVSLAVIVLGSFQIFWLSRKKAYPSENRENSWWYIGGKNLGYWSKLILVGVTIVATALLASLQIGYSPSWPYEIGFWTPVLSCVGLGVAFSIHHLEYDRSKVANGVLLFYWLFFTIVHGIRLRSSVVLRDDHGHLPRLVALAVIETVGISVFLLELMTPQSKSDYGEIGDEEAENECPIETANVFSRLTFGWMTPIMKEGYSKFLTEDDLWSLRKSDSTLTTSDDFNQAWETQLQKENPSIWIALFTAFGGPYFKGALFKVVHDIFAFVQPQLLRLVISFVASYNFGNDPQPLARGIAIAAAMFATSLIQTVALHQYFQLAFETGMRIKSSLTAAIYKKSMRLSNEGRVAKSTGDIVNLQAVDTQRLQDITQYGQQLWSAPFQIVLCMLSLYQLLGPSMFAGIAAMLVMIPINGIIARLMKKLQKTQMKNKDSRTRLMTEILANMKSIKLYGWGTPFKAKLDHVRNDQELYTLKKIGVAQAFSSFTWSSTPFLVSCSTFAVFVFTQDKPLTTEIVFPALTLFNLLTFPLSVLPMVITAVVEAGVAVERITSFLTAEELQADAVVRETPAINIGDESLRVNNGTFTWNRAEIGKNALNNINFTANKGELNCVLGKVGAGKSSLLQALLGDLWKVNGQVVLKGSTAYVAQQAWVMNASVRENIVFGHRFDPEFYQKTVRACALLEDFDALPDGDETQVGEKGISLSGGQKARLTLARAVYARADIYLLDDPLSAVDQHVGRHLIDNVLGQNGLLAGKTRILATNSIPVLREADYIHLLTKGEIVESGDYDSVMAMKGGIYNIIRHMKDSRDQGVDDKSSDSSTIIGTGPGTSQEASSEEDEVPELGTTSTSKQKNRRISLRRASAASFNKDRRMVVDMEDGTVKRTVQGKEFSEKGKVKWSVYGEYAKASNLFAVAVYMLLLLGAQAASVGGNFWLKQWAESNSEKRENAHVGKYIGIYFAFGIGAAALVVLQTMILWVFCAVEAARKMHDKMAVAIFRSPMQFFETTPAGRILNRFSSDIYKIDEVLCRCFNMLFQNSAKSIATIVIISVATPPFIALVIPLGCLYLYIQRYYLRTSRELKRLDSVSRSPIYAHFQESLGGISTIRAYQQQSRFINENEWRVDANLRAYFPSINANRWLAVRLEFIGSIIILGAAGFAIAAVASGSNLSAGMVGLTLSYALQITQSLNWIVRQTVEVETNIVSVERVLEYAALPSEAAEIIPNQRPSTSWPAHGAVSFQNYSARYRPGLDLILKDISLDIKPREKIGIVGRTGAGKSSLTLALFRIIEPASGNISIDSVNTSAIGLNDLRQRLAIIPQDASLFEGTVRDNLDPSSVHDDTELWTVLELSNLKEKVSSMDGKLDARVHEGGSNLSVGERALVNLARALLTPSNILVMDEATGSIDVETDNMLQRTIRDRFRDRTILTIAHRLDTIIDSDRIIVLQAGRVAEFDTPAALLENKESQFYSLVKEAGMLEGAGATSS